MLVLGLLDDIKEWFMQLLFSLDQWIAKGISHVYNFMLYCAGSRFFDVEYVRRITTSIYTLIGIFILFYVAVELIKSIMNPDNLLSGEGSLGKISSRVFIVLVLIVSVPWLFTVAMPQVQRILIGSYSYDDSTGKQTGLIQDILVEESMEDTDPGLRIAGEMLTAFVVCGDSCDDKASDVWTDVASGGRDISEFEKNVGKMKEDIMSYDYTVLISTICLVVALVLLVIFLFDVIKAVCQVWFLELVSPIPIMMYLLPQHPIFDKWVEAVKKAYISLVMRIASASLLIVAMNAIRQVTASYSLKLPGDSASFGTKVLTVITLIGVLMFVVELPKIASDIFGFNLGGGFNFVGKKMMAGGKALGGKVGRGAKGFAKKTAGTIGGGIKGGILANRAARRAGYDTKGSFRSGFATGAGAGWRNSNADGININDGAELAADAYGGRVRKQRAAEREARSAAINAQRERATNNALLKSGIFRNNSGKIVANSAAWKDKNGNVDKNIEVAASSLVRGLNDRESIKKQLDSARNSGDEKQLRILEHELSQKDKEIERLETNFQNSTSIGNSETAKQVARAYKSENRDKL